jgi:hypothetical protein
MAIRVAKNNFSSGELSPRLHGRADVKQHDNGVAEMNNFFLRKNGGCYRRSGSLLIVEQLSNLYKSRIEDFKVNTENTYAIEWNRFIARPTFNQSPLYEAELSIYGTPVLNPLTVSIASHTYTAGDYIDIFDSLGAIELNGRTYKAASVGTNLIKLSDVDGNLIDASAFGAYTSGGATFKHIVFSHIYDETRLEKLTFAQRADNLYIVDGANPPQLLTRQSDAQWTIERFYTKDGPYQAINDTAITLTASGTTGSVTVTASASLFQSTDVDRLISPTVGGTRGWGTITAFTSSTEVTVSISSDFGGTTATSEWRLGAFSDTTGWPRAITFHENRLVFGYTDTDQQRWWTSKPDDYPRFDPTEPDLTVLDNNGINFELSSKDFDAITWLESGVGLFIGTVGGPHLATASGGSLTPTNVRVKKQNGVGSNLIPPVLVNSTVLYTARTGRQIMDLSYNFDIQSFESSELSNIAEHLFKNGTKVVDTAWQQFPDGNVWYVLDNGTLIGMLYDRVQNVVGFHKHQSGGTYVAESLSSGYVNVGDRYRITNNIGGADFTEVGAADNEIGTEFIATNINPTWGSGTLDRIINGVIESVTAVASSDLREDLVYITVKRTINGATRRFVEYFNVEHNPSHNQDYDEAVFVDSSITYSGVAATTFGNLWHLEGEEVQAFADNGVQQPLTVTNGQITLDDSTTTLKVGFKYESRLKFLPFEIQTKSGSTFSAKRSINRLLVRIDNSVGIKHGNNPLDLRDIPFRKPQDETDVPENMVSEDVELLGVSNWDRRNEYYLASDYPLPLNILYALVEMEVGT